MKEAEGLVAEALDVVVAEGLVVDSLGNVHFDFDKDRVVELERVGEEVDLAVVVVDNLDKVHFDFVLDLGFGFEEVDWMLAVEQR